MLFLPNTVQILHRYVQIFAKVGCKHFRIRNQPFKSCQSGRISLNLATLSDITLEGLQP